MKTLQRIETVCGLLATLLGFVALAFAFFGPTVAFSGGSGNGPDIQSNSYSGVMSYAQANGYGTAVFYLVLFGLPLTGVAVGTVLDIQRTVPVARSLLWLSTLLFAILSILALASVGLFLLPALVLAILTSTLAYIKQREAQSSVG